MNSGVGVDVGKGVLVGVGVYVGVGRGVGYWVGVGVGVFSGVGVMVGVAVITTETGTSTNFSITTVFSIVFSTIFSTITVFIISTGSGIGLAVTVCSTYADIVAFKYFSGKGSGEGSFCSVDSEERPVEIGVSGGDSDSQAINNASINIDRDKNIVGYLIGNVF